MKAQTATEKASKKVLDVVVPALARTVEQLEGLHANLLLRTDKPMPKNDNSVAIGAVPVGSQLVSLLQEADALSKSKIPRAMQSAGDLFPDRPNMQTALPDLGQRAVAASLRRRLADFQGFACRPGAPRVDSVEPSATLSMLKHWRAEVSCREALTRHESIEVLGALLRAERAIAELQRAEAACNKRWMVMLQEARQLTSRMKALKSRALKSKERSCDLSAAIGQKSKAAWAKLLDSSRGSEQQAAEKVHAELLQVWESQQQLQSEAHACREQLHKLGLKRRQAARMADLMTSFKDNSRQQPEPPVDLINDAEQEAEGLLWQLFWAEAEASQAVHHDPVHRERPPDEQPVQRSEPPQTPDQMLRPEQVNLPVQSTHPATDAEDVLELADLRPNPGPVTPKLASLIERLALPRDERRRVERGQPRHEGGTQGVSEQEPPQPPEQDPILGSQFAERDVQPAQPYPALPVLVEFNDFPQGPERDMDDFAVGLWDQLPSAPLNPVSLPAYRPSPSCRRTCLSTEGSCATQGMQCGALSLWLRY